jgi:hypothetical protein
MYKRVAIVLILLVVVSGCVGPGSQNGNQEGTVGNGGGNGGQASVSFTEERMVNEGPVNIGIQVESLGGYEFIWVEASGVDGGYMMEETTSQPGLYIADNGVSTVGLGICYKESLSADCGTYSGDPASFNPSVEVYGVSDGEKTLLDEYSVE